MIGWKRIKEKGRKEGRKEGKNERRKEGRRQERAQKGNEVKVCLREIGVLKYFHLVRDFTRE